MMSSSNKSLTELRNRLRSTLLQKIPDIIFCDVNAELGVISTGVHGLDCALGVGGLPKGRIINIYGEESVGKTSLVNIIMAEAHKRGEYTAVIDVEHAYSVDLARLIGVKVDSHLDLIHPTTAQSAMDTMYALIKSGLYSIVCLDSVAALITQEEMDSGSETKYIASVAQIMASELKKMIPVLDTTGTVGVFINQTRAKPMVMFGNPIQQTGGKALKFYASISLEIRRSEFIKENSTIIGNKTKIKVQKNKVAAPYKETEFDFYFSDREKAGIDAYVEAIKLGVERKVITKQGSSWFVIDNTKFNGIKALKDALIDDNEMYESLLSRISTNGAKKLETNR